MLDNFYEKIGVKAFELLYPAICRLQGFKNKRRCCGYNMLLASRNRKVRVTRGRQFAKRENDHFPEISEKSKKRPFSPEFNLENGRVVATKTLTLKMVGLLQLKLPTSTLVGFLINGLIMKSITTYFFRKRRITFFNSKNQEVGFFVCFPDFCFSNRKACDLCSPENLSGDHRKHRGKCENSGFSPALQLAQFRLKISPGNEKADRRSGRRRIEKMVELVAVFGHSDCTSKFRIFKHSPLTFGTL